MSTFETLKTIFRVNWTTILVGWEGLGRISPWPDRWETFPPLLTFEEVCKYCYDAIANTNDTNEISFILDVLDFEKKEPEHALVRYLIKPLSDSEHGDTAFELRKWRAILLSEVLEGLQGDALPDSLKIGEFWLYCGFPSDSPMKQPDLDNMCPEEYGTEEYIKRVVSANKVWLQKEMQEINQI